MQIVSKKQLTSIILVLAVAGVALLVFIKEEALQEEPAPIATPEVSETAEPAPEYEVIGASVQGREIRAYTYGSGDTHFLFVGGIHGGYEWNSVLLAYELMDYFEMNPASIPSNVTVTVIPSANPDGLFAVVGVEGRFALADVPAETKAGLGRFNANDVDLNRNFDCKWKPESMWRGNVVSAGTSAFSEPEAVAIRDFVLAYPPTAVVFLHSQSNAVYASECREGILPETLTVMNTYSRASGYPAVDTFDAYEITGDAEGWLASINIPAVTVELSTHETIEWEKNLAGVKALFTRYGK
jgi:predicted deacylase